MPDIIKNLNCHVKYVGEITGTKKFGIFIGFNTYLTGLLHTSEMNQTTIDKFNNGEYRPGDSIEFYVKETAKDNKIILSDFEIKDEEIVTMDHFKYDTEGTVQEGEIINITDIGSFIKFNFKNKNFIGLYHVKEYPKNFKPTINDKINVFINRVLVEENKIFLKTPKNNI